MTKIGGDEPATGLEAQGISAVPIWDAVVVGAGPAGAMTAFELGRIGKRVLLLDREAFPRWKVCGATLSPGVVSLLSESGLDHVLPDLGAMPLGILRLGGWSTQADLTLNGSMAISRQALDQALVLEAVQQGVEFLPSARVRLGALLEDRRIMAVTSPHGQWEVSTRVVVAADGLGSGILTEAGVPSRTSHSKKRPLVGLGSVYPPSVPGYEPGVIHMAVGEAGYVGMARIETGHLNLAAAVDPIALRAAASPSDLVDFILRDAGWPVLSGPFHVKWKGTPELTRRPQRPGADRLFAVGDAAGYLEPFTGEGVLWALSGARALAPLSADVGEAWDPDLLERWSHLHASMVGRAQRLCGSIAWALARPTLSRNVLRVLRTLPRLAEPVVKRVGSPLLSSA